MVLRKQAYKLRLTVQSASLISACLLAAAYWFEYFAGLNPCTLCYYQRLPHAFMLIVGLLSLTALRPVFLFVLTVLTMSISSLLGLYHAGVEWQLWTGPSGCSSALGTLSGEAGLDQLLSTAVVRCDEVVWSFLGLSMAGWNMVISLAVVIVSTIIYKRV